MKRKLSAALLALALFISLLPAGHALSGEAVRAAETLDALGIVNGNGSGYAAEAYATRAHAAAVIARLSGCKTEGAARFSDVPAWLTDAAALCADRGWIPGTGEGLFSPSAPVTADEYCTFLLRMLGYRDADGDFDPAKANLAARRIGLTVQDYTKDTFTRGDLFCLTADALHFRYKGSDETVLERLISAGAVTRAEAAGLGLLKQEMTARQVFDRYSAAVFQLDTFKEGYEANYPFGLPSNNATGFFIHPSGIAVTNYHSIDEALRAVVTLSNGERFPVDKVLYFDIEIDMAIIKVDNRAFNGTVAKEFATVKMASTDDVRVGDVAYAIGNPLGLGITISSGIIADTDRRVDRYELPCILSSASISQGSSGGALFNEYGEVIAVTSGAYASGNEMYLSVPIDPAIEGTLTSADNTPFEVFLWELPFLLN